MKIILTIAGSDTSAGAGIQQDLKTITALKHYALTVPTALTAQNTMGVTKVMAVPDEMIEAQIDAVLADFKIDAVKIGMLPELTVAQIVVEKLSSLHVPIVCDPVMLSTSGTTLMSKECREYVAENLFPLCTLVTPNIPEATCLAMSYDNEPVIEKESRLLPNTYSKTEEHSTHCQQHSKTEDNKAKMLGSFLSKRYSTSFLIKGGHREDDIMRDTLITTDGKEYSFSSPKVMTRNLHGTGCTLSSAVASFLAEGLPIPEAVLKAKEVIDRGIRNAATLTIGNGNGPLWLF